MHCVSHVVARGVGPDGVLRRQSNAAHSDDHEDGHLKITQGHNVVTQAPHPEEGQAGTGREAEVDTDTTKGYIAVSNFLKH